VAVEVSDRVPLAPRTPGVARADARPATPPSPIRPYRVSVVIPTRNRGTLMAEAVRSVQALAGPDLELEIIVVDNGSTDDTEQVARALGTRYLRATKPGAAATRNVGIRAATGDYLGFLDDDDVWLPGHLRPQLALLEARPELAACIGQIIPVDEAGRPLAAPYPESLPDDGDAFQAFLSDFPQIGSLVVRTSVRETVGYQDDTHVWGEDWDWFLRIALEHKVGHVPVPAILFRSRPVATTAEDETHRIRVGTTRRAYWRNVWRGRHRRLSPAFVVRRALQIDGIFAWYFVQSGAAHAAAGDPRTALRSLVRALRISPLHVGAAVVRRPGMFGWVGPALARLPGALSTRATA
jgi:glycosyltransferase involved in cell wall biosynthesis